MGRSRADFRGQGRLSYLEALAAFACGARLSDLPPPVLARARWVIADSLPVIAAGMRQPEMQAFLKNFSFSGKAWVVGTGKRASALDAAQLNGMAGTWLELNEGNLYAKGHPSIQVVPAAIALSQQDNSSGSELLMAFAVGYEVSSRISRAAKVRIEVHPHGTWGVIGAAVAAGRLKGFDAGKMQTLINVAASLGLATSRQTLLEGATVRNLFAGHSGRMGLTAAQLVESGFTGEKDSPSAVFGKVLSDGFDPANAVEGLGEEWMLGQGYFKLHPTGRYVHSALDALEDLLSTQGLLKISAIKAIHVKAYRLCAMLKEKATSSFGARFSVPFALATYLHHGGSSLAAFEDKAVNNPDIQKLASLVQMEESKDYTARYPGEQRCDVRMILDDGKTVEGRCIITKGELSRPHSEAELTEKFMRLGTTAWGEKTARELLAACLRLEEVQDFGKLSEGFAL